MGAPRPSPRLQGSGLPPAVWAASEAVQTFPGMFLGAAGGIPHCPHLPGLPTMRRGVAMGIGAMTVVMLNGLPLTAILLTSLLSRPTGCPSCR